MKENALAIITARGGSKRIPKKNMKEFCGRPIIAYAIESALQSNLFAEVMVSTDSKEIAETAMQYGAKVPFMRSERTSDDFSTTADVIIEVLSEYQKYGRSFQYTCCLYPTAAFVTAAKLQEAMKLMERKKPTMIMPVAPFSFPPQRGMIISKDGFIKYSQEKYRKCRSQDLDKMYHDAGQFYIYDTEKFLDRKGNITDDILPLVLPELYVQDIDTIEDWKLAELKYNMLYTNV